MEQISAIIFLAFMVGWWWLWFKLFKKIGHPGTHAFFMFLPLVNLIIIIWFIFSGWPNRQRVGQRVGKML